MSYADSDSLMSSARKLVSNVMGSWDADELQ